MKLPLRSYEQQDPGFFAIRDADNARLVSGLLEADAEFIVTACNAHGQLVHELTMIDIKAEAGLCQRSHGGARAFYTDIRDIVKRALAALTAAGAT